MPNPQSRLLALAAEAKQQYLAECAAGGEPAYPAWIEDALAVCGGGQYDTAAPGISTVEDAQAVAWMDPDTLDVINADRKASWLADFGAGAAAKAANYTRALGDLRPAPAAGDALDAARWRAYAAQFPEISTAFLAVHAVDGGDPLPTIKGASITGGYVVVTPAGWCADKATKLRDAILRRFPVNPVHTPRPSDELAAQRKGDA